MKNLAFENTKVKDGFWKFYENLNKNVAVYAVYNRFRETGRFDALKCNWKEDSPNKPHWFWDSDVAKWLEGVAYIIEQEHSSDLEKLADEAIDDISANQRPDGYFNSYFLGVEPSKALTLRRYHELYTLGHYIEAAIAYHVATGKDKLLNCILKNVDYIYKIFVEEESADFSTPYHEEIELALLKLYEYTGNEKHLELSRYFINKRGNNDKDPANEKKACEKGLLPRDPSYDQTNVPLRQATEAVGHAVRAGYIYTAMAMLAKVDRDDELKAACDRVFENITNKKMSITGCIGADPVEENFSYNYDIPNSGSYNETCASISLAMFAGAMQEIEANPKYADLIERIYFNGLLSSISLSGDKFFYTNPLEIDQKKYSRSTYQPVSQRAKVFSCSCCPPNVVRTLASISRYSYSVDGNDIYCNQFISGETKLCINGKEATIDLSTNYPSDGKLIYTYHGDPVNLYVRIPYWCVEYKGKNENGYELFNLCDGESVVIDLPMNVHFIEANPYVQDNSGRYAVMRGPIVYCMEGIDNGENLRDITLVSNENVRVKSEECVPAPVLYMDALRRKPSKELYYIKNDDRETFVARLIPYFAFANRDATDMIVWTMVK